MFLLYTIGMLVHAFKISRVNGPGRRFTLWTQGCTKGCKNCYNPATWKFEGKEFSIDYLLEKVGDAEGITVTGGDPLEQEDILEFLKGAYNLNLPKGIILFSGFTIDEINNSNLRECLNYIDVLIDGRYEEELRISSSLRGSSNQNIIFFSDKLKEEELFFDHEIEVGADYITGFPSLDRKFLKQFGVIV